MTDTSQHLQRVAVQLSMHLDGNTLKRSTIERILAMSPDPQVRAHVLSLIDDAGVEITDDVAPCHAIGRDLPVGSSRPTPTPHPADPIGAARRLLQRDKNLPTGKLHKRILTSEEEVGLTLLARPDGSQLPQGGFARLEGEAREAAQAMLLHNLGLAHYVAQDLVNHGVEYEDLVHHGTFGLMRAIELFDPSMGTKFSTYAMWWVRQSMSRAIANEGRLVRIPVHVWDELRKVAAAKEHLTVDGRSPSWAKIARECHFSVEKVEQLMKLMPNPLSLDATYGQDGFTLADVVDRPISREEIDVHGLDERDIDPLLSTLAAREQDILRRRHGLPPYDYPQTLEEIGKQHNVTRERIRQLENHAMQELRDTISGSSQMRV